MEDRWAKLEEIVRKVVREEIAVLGKKEKTKIKLVNGRWEGITQDVLQAMKDAYPAVEVEAQLKEAAAWCLMNPNDAPRSEFGRFLGTWMKRHQDRHSIRSIPFGKSDPKAIAPSLCEYCLKPSVGAVNGIRYCRDHGDDAMDMKPRPKMPGVAPKMVAGVD